MAFITRFFGEANEFSVKFIDMSLRSRGAGHLDSHDSASIA